MSTCKLCFKEIKIHGFGSLMRKDICICQKCFNEWNPQWIYKKINDVDVIAIYPYDETIKSFLFQFKGCYDIELKNVFLDRQKSILKAIFKGYVLIPLPSNLEEDEIRGFNHVEEMFSCLGLQIEKVLFKKVKYKQSDLSFEERKEVYKKIGINNVSVIKGKKVLIVDDVITSGSSIKAAIDLIKKCNPKMIKVVSCSINLSK